MAAADLSSSDYFSASYSPDPDLLNICSLTSHFVSRNGLWPGYRIEEVFNKPLRVNAIGSVTKKDTGEPRPITDMSRPLNNSVNDYISCKSYRYNSSDDAIALMRPDCFFATVDIKSAYRWVPVYPPHRTLQGSRWVFNGSYKFFTDNFLCFGLKNAPSIFHRISCALTRMMARKGCSNIVNYLDIISHCCFFTRRVPSCTTNSYSSSPLPRFSSQLV